MALLRAEDQGEWILNSAMGRNFQDRQQASQSAKAKMLEKFKSRPSDDDPVVAQQRAERLAIAEARAAREAAKEAERLRLKAEAEALAAAEKAAREEAERIAAEEREAARKAEEARLAAERPRKSLMDAVQYAQMRAAGKGRR
jgi:hypothetical protein